MSRRRGVALALWLLLIVAVLLLLWFTPTAPEAAPRAAARTVGGTGPVATAPPVIPPPRVTNAAGDAPSRIADALNAPEGTIRRDLDIVSELFVAWQSNFPREGNPVGDNAEITAVLAGDNRLHFAFIPRTHPAINSRGELCDRWGTPFRFHQVSGQHMEIRSAGPDRKFATADDVQWPPDAGR